MARKTEATTRTISLTGDHVHMPADLATAAWAECSETARYDRKVDGRVAKYTVHADLADFLIGRDQAVEVMPDPVDEPQG